MSTTFVILNVAFATLVVGVITGMMLWAIKTSPSRLQMTRSRSALRPSGPTGVAGSFAPFTAP